MEPKLFPQQKSFRRGFKNKKIFFWLESNQKRLILTSYSETWCSKQIREIATKVFLKINNLELFYKVSFFKEKFFFNFSATFSHFCDWGKFSSPTLSPRTERPKVFWTAFRGANDGCARRLLRRQRGRKFPPPSEVERKRKGKVVDGGIFFFFHPTFCVPKM